MRNAISRFYALRYGLLLVVFASATTLGQQPSAAPANPARENSRVDAVETHASEGKVVGVGANTSANVKLGPGDLLEITVFGVPDLTEKVRLGASGDLSFALIGSVHAAGLSPQELEAAIEEKLQKGYVRDPHVTVLVLEYATQGVSVLGEVTKPGVYVLLGTRRLYDAISAAGGLTPNAGTTVMIVHRDDPDHPVKLPFSSDPTRSLESNVEVRPGDTIIVSKTGLIYVVGDLNRPGGFAMNKDENLTVMQAIALAEGVRATADLSKARVIRRSGGTPQEIPIPLKQILAAKVADIRLQEQDIVFIPGSIAKGAARRSAEAIIQIATGVAIYRP